MIAIEVEISEYKWVIANFYGPNDDDAKCYVEAWSLLELLDNDNIIYGGDFNMNLEPCDKRGTFELTKKREMLKEYMSEKDFVDVWRLLHPDSFQFTWRRIRPVPVFSRLDFFLVPNQLINRVFQAEICPGYKSDHSRITLTLKLSSLARGRGLWQLNETYLSNQDYVNMINNSIDEFLENNAELNPTLKWDMIKMNLKEKSIIFHNKKGTWEEPISEFTRA